MQSDLRYWIALNAIQSLSYAKIKKLLTKFSEVKAIFAATETQLLMQGLTQRQASLIARFNPQSIKKDLQWLEVSNQHIILINDDAYPNLLKTIKDPPLLLYVKGRIDVLQKTQLAIIGSRKPTPFGERMAVNFAGELSRLKLTITSGLALGIDGAAHRGTLAANGQTIAILGTGLDQLYPKRHSKLAAQIVESGALVSEFSLGTPPLRENFPRRNRIISGMSLGVLVVEAALKSGSLITARLAAEQGREVFAIPGSVGNSQTKGCHQLIREGAILTDCMDDICTELTDVINYQLSANIKRPIPPKKETLDFAGLDKDHIGLLKLVNEEPVPVDELIVRSGFTASRVAGLLMNLELDNWIVATTGGYCRIR